MFKHCDPVHGRAGSSAALGIAPLGHFADDLSDVNAMALYCTGSRLEAKHAVDRRLPAYNFGHRRLVSILFLQTRSDRMKRFVRREQWLGASVSRG